MTGSASMSSPRSESVERKPQARSVASAQVTAGIWSEKSPSEWTTRLQAQSSAQSGNARSMGSTNERWR